MEEKQAPNNEPEQTPPQDEENTSPKGSAQERIPSDNQPLAVPSSSLSVTKEEKAVIEEFKNASVKVQVEKKPHCVVHLTVNAYPPILKAAYETAYKSVRKEVTVPGFRKGKAPKEFVEKNYSGSIQNRFPTEAANLAFSQAMSLIGIPLLDNKAKIQFSSKEFSPENAVFTFGYETEPNVPEVDPANYTNEESPPNKLTEKELEEGIRQILFFHAKWDTILDRPVQEGDFVIIDLKTLDEPSEVVFSDTRFEVSDDHMAKWMKNLLIGKKTGEEIEGYSEPDESEKPTSDETPSPKKHVLVTLKKIEQAEVPPLDEAFAKTVGAQNVDELKKATRKQLQARLDAKFFKEQQQKVNLFLLEKYPFDLPISLIEAEKNHRKQQLLQNREFASKLQAASSEEKKQFEQELFSESEASIRLFYLSRSIVQRNNFPISDEEVEEEAQLTLATFGPVNVDTNKIPQELYALALSKVLLTKAQQFILSGGKTEKSPPAMP